MIKMECQPENLFLLETNEGFIWENFGLAPLLQKVAGAFGLPRIKEVSILKKPNQNSSLYRLTYGEKRIIVRSAESRHGSAVEQQCGAVHAIAYQNIVKPLTTLDGAYTFTDGDRTWIAYPEIKGVIFSGKNCDPKTVVKECVILLDNLSSFANSLPDSKKFALPHAEHQVREWSNLIKTLTDSQFLSSSAMLNVNNSTKNLLLRNQKWLAYVTRSIVRLPAKNTTLVHNDLQHANILIYRSRPFFLDIEDICFENREIAVCHAVFKILRHVVYTKACTYTYVRDMVVPEILKLLTTNGFAIRSSHELFCYGLYRTVSDIHTIIYRAVKLRDPSMLYDLEKKIHNIFELSYFFH